MKSLSAVLENFDSETGQLPEGLDVRSQQLKAKAYAEGFAAGEAAAQSKLEEQNMFIESIVDKLDREFAAIQLDQVHEFTISLKKLITAIFPVLAEKGLLIEAQSALEKRQSFVQMVTL